MFNSISSRRFFSEIFSKCIGIVTALLVGFFGYIAISPQVFADNSAFCATVVGVPTAECEALMNIYDTMGGTSWTNQDGNWGASVFVCGMWRGVTCTDGHVTGISRPYDNLTGDFHITEGNLDFLTTLNIPNNNITSFYVDGMPSLQDLRIYNNDLTSFPTSGLSELTYLNVLDNYLTTFDGTNFGNLVTLNLNYNDLTTFSGTGLNSLNNLYIQNNLLTTFSNTGMPVLDYLRLDSNMFTTFSGTGFGALTYLALNDNLLTSFVNTGFDALLTLNLENNQLTSFVGTGLETLTNLFLQYNDLTTFDGVGMHDLTYLDIYLNNLTTFDGTDLSSLQDMRIYDNQLTEFSGTGMDNLVSLELNNNLLTTFDGSMLYELEYITLYNNQLTTFSGAGLEQLSYLDLWNNNLTSLYITGLTGGISGFDYFDISNNFLAYLPPIISELPISDMVATENCFVRASGLLSGPIVTWLDSFVPSWEIAQPRGCPPPPVSPVTVTCSPSASSAFTDESITWTAIPSGGDGNFMYSWTGTDDLTGTSDILSKSYSTIGTKSATVIAYSGGLSSAPTACEDVLIAMPTTPEPVTVTCSPSASSARTGDPITWTAVASGGSSSNYTFEWTGTDGLAGTDNPLLKNYTTSGIKSATVVATEGGSPSEPITCSTTISNPPSGGGGGGPSLSYGCTDPKALNYKKSVLSRSSMCEYLPEITPSKTVVQTTESIVPNTLQKLDSAPIIDTTLCSARTYPTKYIKSGGKNDPEQVKLLEQYLAVFENENLPIDGIYSQDDANAVIRWQEKYRSEILTPWGASRGTGYIFITSLRKFRELFEMQCKPDEYVVPETPSYFYRDLKLGMKGDDVRKLQEILITKSTGGAAQDLARIGATGYFGVMTKAALIEFQKAHLLNPATGEMNIITTYLLTE